MYPLTPLDRRSINRKSAQKHRIRRREEVNTLSRKVAERDAEIIRLKRDLAVEKSKSNQYAGIIKMQIETSGGHEKPGPW